MPGYDNQDCIVEVELFNGGEQHGRLALDGTGVSLFEVEQAAIKARAAPESRVTSAIRLVGVIRPLTEHGNPSFSRRFSHQGRHLSPRLGTSAVPQAVAAPARPGPAHGSPGTPPTRPRPRTPSATTVATFTLTFNEVERHIA